MNCGCVEGVEDPRHELASKKMEGIHAVAKRSTDERKDGRILAESIGIKAYCSMMI